MLQDYEECVAETPDLILNIPGILDKEHHTKLKSLTLGAMNVTYPSATWARAHRWVESLSSSPIAAPSGHKSTNHRVEASAVLLTSQIPESGTPVQLALAQTL